MASVKFFSAATVVAASVSVAVFAGCQPSPTEPPSTGPTIDPGSVLPLDPLEPSDPLEPGDPGDPVEPEPTEPTEPATDGGAQITGLVYDDEGNKLDGVTITVKRLDGGTFANDSDTLSVVSNVGAYTFEDCPAGVQLQVTATKNGYTVRQQTFVAKLGTEDAPAVNQLNFGGSSTAEVVKFALSTKPEVTEFVVDDEARSFTLTFSTAVKQSDVVDHLAIYVAGNAGGKHTLSASDVALTHRYDGGKDTGSNGISEVIPDKAKFVYDKAAFDSPVWTSDKEVTFKLRDGIGLPADKEAAKVPQYAVSFKGTIHDTNGSNGRSDRFFRLRPAEANRVGASFKPAADTKAPELVSLTALTRASHNGQHSVIRAQFSEPMVHFLGDQDDKPIPRNAAGSGYALRPGMLKYAVAAQQPTFNFGVASSAKDGFLPKALDGGAPGTWHRGDTIELQPLSEGTSSAWAGDKVSAISGTTMTLAKDVSQLMIGDVLQIVGQPSFLRVTGVDTAKKEVTFTGPAPARNANLAYWQTTATEQVGIGGKSIHLATVGNLENGDRLRLTLRNGSTQTVTVTSRGHNTVDFTPGLTDTVLSSSSVTFVPAPTGYGNGDTVWVGINPIVTDPAGNPIGTGGNLHRNTAQ